MRRNRWNWFLQFFAAGGGPGAGRALVRVFCPFCAILAHFGHQKRPNFAESAHNECLVGAEFLFFGRAGYGLPPLSKKSRTAAIPPTKFFGELVGRKNREKWPKTGEKQAKTSKNKQKWLEKTKNRKTRPISVKPSNFARERYPNGNPFHFKFEKKFEKKSKK